LKLNKAYRFVIFKISDNPLQIVVEKTAPPSATWNDFVRELPKDEPRYAVYDFEFTVGEGVRNKVIFVTWSPEISKTKPKMLYASSKDAFQKKLVGLAKVVQATDPSEIDYQFVLEQVAAGAR